MEAMRVCLLALLLLGLSWSGADGCSWMKSNFHSLSNSSTSHLQQACKNLAHHSNLSLEFPNRLYSQATDMQTKDLVLFVLRTLEDVMKLFIVKHEQADCEEQKLQTFMLDLHRQITELQRCAKKTDAAEANKKLRRKMAMHFRSLVSHLKHTDYSAEGWGDVTGMVLQHLRRLDLLTIKTKPKSSV